MFRDLCWGSFNYNTYKGNISLFPKWIHKILSHVSLSFLYTFYPPNTFRIHFVSKITSADANQQKASSPTNKAQEHEFFRNMIMILCHSYDICISPWFGMIHDTNFFEFVEVTPTFCNTIRVSEITTELKGFGPNCLQNGEISCNSKYHCRLWSQNSLPKL